ncbi:MAG: NnrS family protein [Sphingomonadaceae bacterium]|nr:NnrS family protein [Sphingomonadaceae bacterium]
MQTGVILAAPHRALFLVGTLALALGMLWWLTVLSGLYYMTPAPAGGLVPQSLLHAPLLLFLALPPLFFGFLLTVFPRWMGFPDLDRPAYAPVAALYALGLIFAAIALPSGSDFWLKPAFCSGLLAMLWAYFWLWRLALAERREGRGPTWHSWSILAALTMGFIAQAVMLSFLHDPANGHVMLANQLGLWGFTIPVFFTVCHRMLPFFAGNVVAGYVRWRPMWLLGAFWAGTMILVLGMVYAQFGSAAPADHGAHHVHFDNLAHILGAALLTALSALMTYKWWPRGRAPALLWVLIIGFAWAPIGYGLALLTAWGVPLGRASEHALTIGFASSLIIAMVTRVTQGHSGRPLVLPLVGTIGFVGMQLAALARVGAAIHAENGPWLVISAGIFLVALLPWVLRNARIYLAPRVDGRPG